MERMPVETLIVRVESKKPLAAAPLPVVRDVMTCRVDTPRVCVRASVMFDPPFRPKNPFDIVKYPHWMEETNRLPSGL